MGKKRGWANYYALKRRRILFSLTEKSIILKFYDFIHYNYEKKTRALYNCMMCDTKGKNSH